MLSHSLPSAAPHSSFSRSSPTHRLSSCHPLALAHCLFVPLKIFPELPAFSPSAEPSFTWEFFDSATFVNSLNAAYGEVVHLKPNFFKVPHGSTGKSFVSEPNRMYMAFATGSAMEYIAMKAAIVLPVLLLQKPSRNSKAKEHSACLGSHLKTGRMEF